jgi:hypothetical protein
MRIIALPLALAAAVLAGAPAHAGEDWTEFRSNPGGFSVLLPGAPRYFKKVVNEASGPTPVHNYAATDHPNVFLISYLDVPADAVNVLGADYILQNFKAGFLRSDRLRVLSERSVTVQGARFKELRFAGSRGPARGVCRFGVLGSRLFNLSVTSPNGSGDGEAAARFFGSFRTLSEESARAGKPAAKPAKAAAAPAGAKAKRPRASLVSVRAAGPGEKPWAEFRMVKGGPAVQAPGTPVKASKRVLKTPSGKVEYHHWNLVAQDEIYGVAFADCPNAAGADPQALLADHRDGFVQASGGKLVTDQPLQVGGYPGSEFRIELSPGVSATIRLVLVKSRVYQLAVISPSEKSYSDAAVRFLESFRLPEALKTASR